MLRLLHIENIAVIALADIAFEGGFNVLTGETGAGKSIVIDAIGAVIGGRTSREMIRTGAARACVEAIFCDLPDLPWFGENGLLPDEEGSLIIRREIQSDGKSSCRVNGRAVTVTQLRALGEQLLDIHGQHDGQRLLDERTHLSYLDQFGGVDEAVSAYAASYRTFGEISREIESFSMDEAEKSRRMDTLRFQIAELEGAALKAGEEEALLERRNILRNAERITDAVARAHFALLGDEDSAGALSQVGAAQRAIQEISDTGEELAELAAQLADLRCGAEDAAERLRDLQYSMDFEPGELDQIEERLDVLYRLHKKYGSTTEEMLSYLANSKEALDRIEYAGDALAKLEQKRADALAQVNRAGAALTRARCAAGKQLDARVGEELQQLDMPNVRFETRILPKEERHAMDATGMDDVCFLISANAGEELRSIHKIASGGELARIMLALKNVLAENELVSTMIFDEVDTGVSGRAAQKVGEKMADVARGKQVLCVTHLPQIAAMADVHFSVRKGEQDGRTFTAVCRLDRAARQAELARLSAGTHITSAALESAGEMLDAAAGYKKQCYERI
ncbi:MAG: DNA repair protein RecN [Oscillospiraceae bacterium]|nr:DNA repair protein RecN [Oscillospiraceae bacterium]